MAFKERIGATGDSLRIKNNEWYIARSFDGNSDIKVFRVNELDQVEFNSVPSVDGDAFVLQSVFEALEERVYILEQIIGSITAGNINIVPFTLTPLDISNKSVTLPQAPISGKTLIIPANGIPQLCDVDFVVSGSTISWNGYPFENIVSAGDVIKVIFMY